MNKQNRGDYGNAPNTPVPVKPCPNYPAGQDVQVPAPQQTPHPFKASAPKA